MRYCQVNFAGPGRNIQLVIAKVGLSTPPDQIFRKSDSGQGKDLVSELSSVAQVEFLYA
jgi:hypothetical protein